MALLGFLGGLFKPTSPVDEAKALAVTQMDINKTKRELVKKVAIGKAAEAKLEAAANDLVSNDAEVRNAFLI